jgi:hypothetical protein
MTANKTIKIQSPDGSITELEINRIQFFWQKPMLGIKQPHSGEVIPYVTQIIYRTDEPYTVREDTTEEPPEELRFGDNDGVLFPMYLPYKRTIVTGRAVVETESLMEDLAKAIREKDDTKTFVVPRRILPYFMPDLVQTSLTKREDLRVFFVRPSEALSAIFERATFLTPATPDYLENYNWCYERARRCNGGGSANSLTMQMSWLPTYDHFGIYISGGLSGFALAFKEWQPQERVAETTSAPNQ